MPAFHNFHLAQAMPDLPNIVGTTNHAVLITERGRVAYIGAEKDYAGSLPADSIDLHGRWVTPGLIDCHTHLVYGGDRAGEFARRLAGESYASIAQSGGGILSTVRHTRDASEDALLAQSLPRAKRLLAGGTTTVEIKSGYGLNLASERKMLRVAKRITETLGMRVITTFLGAHAVPPEFAGHADDYIDTLIHEMMPTLHAEGLIDAVDAFCEGIGFTPEQTERVFAKAQAMGLPVKLHADQLSNLSGAGLAARFSALSADHIEYSDEASVKAMAKHGCIAVLLPGAFFALQETQKPPIDLLRKHQVPMAIATDLNPGTSPMCSLTAAMNMACVQFGLTVDEALIGTTWHAAKALGKPELGLLAEGHPADFAVWNIPHPASLSYWVGGMQPDAVYVGGKAAFNNP